MKNNSLIQVVSGFILFAFLFVVLSPIFVVAIIGLVALLLYMNWSYLKEHSRRTIHPR